MFHQKQTKLRTVDLTANKNISFPIGTILTVQEYYSKLGMDEIIGQHKSKGHDINGLVQSMTSYRLTENRSVTKAAVWANRPMLLHTFELDPFDQRAFYRMLEILGQNREEIIADIQDAIFLLYDFKQTDTNMDWTSFIIYGEKCPIAKRGYSRDHRPDKKQITVGISELASPINVPIGLTIREGNINDQVHFTDTFNQIKDKLKQESMVVFDQGANRKENLDQIENANMKYLTIRHLNTSDDKTWIGRFNKSKAELVDEKRGVYGMKKRFPSRFNYMYFSEELKLTQIETKLRKVDRLFREAEEIQSSIDRNRRLPKRYRINNPLVECKYSYQTKLTTMNEQEAKEILKAASITGREGFFCLVSNKDLTLKEALAIYRRKDSIEKIFNTLKNEINIHPLRVWTDDAVYGALVLGFIELLIIALIRYEHEELKHVSPIFIKFALMDLTLTIEFGKNGGKREILSNFTAISSVILGEKPAFS
jgi:transposase